jgi:hypothetical protein
LTDRSPEPYEALIRYYGAASSTARRGAGGSEEATEEHHEEEPLVDQPVIVNDRAPATTSSWRRLLGKIYGVDPLLCPRCGGKMRVISVINDPEVIERILKHLDLWNPPRGPPETSTPERTVDFDEGSDGPFSE